MSQEKPVQEENMRRLLNTKAIVILVLAFPIAAWADVSGTPTLAANTPLNLDTGATTASGGDLVFNGSTVTPQGNATAVLLPVPGGFATYTQSNLEAVTGYLKSAINVGVGTLFAVKTNGGNYAKVLVTGRNTTVSIVLQFTTYESSAGPHITQVLNNYGLIPAGLPNNGIAPGSLFIIKGTGLADPNAQALPLQSSAGAGLPTTLNGASVQVTVNGTTTVPVFYYAIATQLALVLPSNTGTLTRGGAQITVTYNNQTTGAFPIQVVQSAMGFDAYYGTGSGLGVATNNATGTLYDYSNSIPPGTTVVLWGSGLGADPQRDTKYVPAAFPINGLAHVYIGGVDAPIVYQGASGYPGLNQVDVTVPASVPLGCNVSLVGVTAAGMPTNFLTLPIGNGACSDAPFGTSGNQRQSLSGKSTVNTGTVLVLHSTSPGTTSGSTQVNDIAEASFQSISGASYGAASNSVSLGSCIATQTAGAGGGGGTATGLDAGTISMAGPVGSPVTLNGIPQSPGTYVAQLATGAIPSSGGTFAFHGAGGTQVGAFDTSVVFPNPLLNWTNQDADAGVAQGKALNASWTGGAPNSVVYIGGNSSATVGGETVNGSFLCLAPVSAQQFTVPAYVLAALPLGNGNLYMENITKYQSFAASGLDAGYAFGGVQYTINWTYRSNVAAKKASGQ